MEKTGAAIDRARLRSMLETFTADATQAQNIAWEQAGSQINLQSPKQLKACFLTTWVCLQQRKQNRRDIRLMQLLSKIFMYALSTMSVRTRS